MTAGSGKTTVGRAILESSDIPENRTLCMAYTGQAVRRMRQAGLEAYTIHRSIMQPKKKSLFIDGKLQHRGGIPYTTYKWDFIKDLPDWVEALFIDEYSFVNSMMEDKMKELAYKKGIPMFCVGDPEQLSPVQGSSRFSINDLHFFLDKPRRQALESKIYQLAMEIREGKIIDIDDYSFKSTTGKVYGSGQVLFLNKFNDNEKMVREYRTLLKHFEAMLVNTNALRNDVTDMIRNKILGIDTPYPVAGDKVICRQNNMNLMIDNDYPLVNGTVGYCMRDIPLSDIDFKKQLYTMDFRPMDITSDYFDSLICDLEYLNTPFQSNKPKDKYNNGNKMEYSYANTVHSSQGMQYANAGYLEHWIPNPDLMRRLRYTAITRAWDLFCWFI